MSVLIKDMKIPQSCYMCDMLELSGAVGCKHAYTPSNSEWGRALNCPLIELPDHGDLVDVDEVMKTANEMAEYWETEYELPRILRNAPVIIPAERREDEH